MAEAAAKTSEDTNDEDDGKILIAIVEGGGTSFRVAVAELQRKIVEIPPIILHRSSIDSSHDDPTKTLTECVSFFTKHKPSGGYHALGVATFGPVGLNSFQKEEYGRILKGSPKQAWRNVNILQPIADACRGTTPMAIRIETDVNAPALSEYQNAHRLDKSLTSLAYITVGTGVGVGLVINRKCVHGRMHPEGGHVAVQPLTGDTYKGYSWGTGHSPYGGKHTVEGIASSVALTERLQQLQQNEGAKELSRNVLSTLPDEHEVWDHAANAIANLSVTLILTTSIERIVLGGGVLKRSGLIEKVRTQTVKLINGYVELPKDLSTYITLSQYGDDAGFMGAVTLAQRAYQESQEQESIEEKDTESSSSSSSAAFYGGVIHGIVVGAMVAIGVMSRMGQRRKS
mmetsp:Transcript_17507/g.24622  ORF Transcript_17507/g.24622 Transcript_17507/m.24622 type:complete len:400 (-) Transcript_17507:218-1417(-)